MRQNESFKRLMLVILSLLGLIVQAGLYAWVWFAEYYPFLRYQADVKFFFNGHVLMIGIYFVLLFFFSNMYGGTKIGYFKPMEVFFSKIFSLICVDVISYFQISLLRNWLVDVQPMLLLLVLQIVFAGVWTWLSNLFYRKVFPPRKLLLVYGERPIEDIMQKFESRKDKYKIVKCINISEGKEAVQKEIEKGYEGIVFWDIPSAVRNKMMKFCYSRSIRVYFMPKIPDVLIKGSESLHLFDTPIFLTREYALSIEQRIVKRIIDIVCSLILLIVTSPIMLITALVIKCYDKGPVLYRQIRCTKDGREFGILKFRSMRVDAEKDGVARLAAKNDSRITPIGKFIRAVRIDELPQLINILKGDMSFIGPRPERPQIIAQYLEEMPEFAFRMKVKAGLAGYAQIYGKYNTTPYDKLKLDLSYIENYSVWLDIKLMLLTLKILFKPESTEGVDAKQITAMKKEAEQEER